MKLLPDAFSNFRKIIKNNYVYIDKTHYIQKYENTGAMVSLFLRPRRFGKTMFAEILRYYYDKALTAEGDDLFKETWIASHPTPYKNSYGVVKFDFSGIQVNSGVNVIMRLFIDCVIDGVVDFYKRYPDLIPPNIISMCPDNKFKAVRLYYSDNSIFPTATTVLRDFLSDFSANLDNQFKIMVIIDEYDNFTNDLLSRDPGQFAHIARKEGEVGAFYNALRYYNQSDIVDRIFITGVLPVTMDTAVSGFVSSKLSQIPVLNSLAGFTDDEVLELVREAVDLERCPFSPEQLRDVMKARYDGYRFSSVGRDTVYNPTLCISFVNSVIYRDYQDIPELDISSANDIDYQKLTGYLNLINEKDRKTIINAIIRRRLLPVVFPGAVKITSKHDVLDRNQGSAILYHLGFFTLASETEIREENKNSARNHLKVPNEYFRLLFSRYYFQTRKIPWSIFEGSYDFRSLAVRNDLSVFKKFLREIARAFVNTDNASQCEAQIGLAVYTALALNTGTAFRLIREYAVKHDGKYVMTDTPDDDDDGQDEDDDFLSVSTRAGRADLVVLNLTGKGPSYIFEFKYVRDTSSKDETKEKVREDLLEQARKQLEFYVTDDDLRVTPDLHRYILMYTYGEFFLQEVM